MLLNKLVTRSQEKIFLTITTTRRNFKIKQKKIKINRRSLKINQRNQMLKKKKF